MVEIPGFQKYMGQVDLVVNVESSHCYGNFKVSLHNNNNIILFLQNFVQQVDKFLKPGGLFCITDFRYNDTDDKNKQNNIRKFKQDLESFSMVS